MKKKINNDWIQKIIVEHLKEIEKLKLQFEIHQEIENEMILEHLYDNNKRKYIES